MRIILAAALLLASPAAAHPHHGCRVAAQRLYSLLPPDPPPTPPVSHAGAFPADSPEAAIQARSDARDWAIYEVRLKHYSPTATRDMLVATCADRSTVPLRPGTTINITINRTTTTTDIDP